MAGYDALRHVSIGVYIPGDSVIHRLDARIKLVSAGLLTLAIVWAVSYTANLVLLAAILALVWLARLPVGFVLRSLKPALPMILVLSILQLIFYRGQDAGQILVSIKGITISAGGVRLVITSLMRFVDLLFLTSLVTNTTTLSALTHAMERLLRPLDRVGLPGNELAMIAALALRFLPILGEQMASIARAQASRTVIESRDARWQVVRNARRKAALIIPLFVDAFRRADEIGLAMRARCYSGGRGRTSLRNPHISVVDAVALTCASGMLVVMILARQWPLV